MVNETQTFVNEWLKQIDGFVKHPDQSKPPPCCLQAAGFCLTHHDVGVMLVCRGFTAGPGYNCGG